MEMVLREQPTLKIGKKNKDFTSPIASALICRGYHIFLGGRYILEKSSLVFLYG